MKILTSDDVPNRVVPCPSCGKTERITWMYFPEKGMMDIMCWGDCGMDYAVPGTYWVLNTWSQEEQQ